MKYRALIGIGVLCALHSFAVAADAGHLAPYVKKLNAAEGLDVAYSVAEVGGSTNDYRVVLAKPDKALIVTPFRSFYADGTNITTFNKSKNTYFVEEQSEETLKRLLSGEQFVLWRAFFDPTAFDDVESTKDEGTRKRRGEDLQIISAQMDAKGEKTYMLYISQQDGLVRQAQFLDTSDANKSTSILTVDSINTNKQMDAVFQFAEPAGARRLTEMDLRAEFYSDLISIATTERSTTSITYKPVQPENRHMIDPYIDMVIEEFSKYPIEFFKASKVKKIVLCEELTNRNEHVGGVPELGTEILYYDVTFLPLADEIYARYVVHHEFYHMCDEEWLGSDYRTDKKWLALNDKDFTYRSLGRNQRNTGVYSNAVKGIINPYASYAAHEDKAELWTAMFIPWRWKLVKEIAAADPIVASKIDHLRKQAESKCAAMDDEYWKEVSGEGGK